MTTTTTTAWADAAAIMLALAGTDRDTGQAALEAMIASGDTKEISLTLAAALDIGASIIQLENTGRQEPGPLTEYISAVSHHKNRHNPLQ